MSLLCAAISCANTPHWRTIPPVRERLNAAFAETKALGFTHDAPIVDFLYMDAIEPGFYKVPPVAAWLNKPGVPAEQRFEMLQQVAQKKQQEMKEKH